MTALSRSIVVSIFHRNGRNSASLSKSRAFAVMTVMPVRAALIAIKASLLSRPLPICSKSDFAARGASFSSLRPIFQIGYQNSAGPIKIAFEPFYDAPVLAVGTRV
jgi:hypothetical protein